MPCQSRPVYGCKNSLNRAILLTSMKFCNLMRYLALYLMSATSGRVIHWDILGRVEEFGKSTGIYGKDLQEFDEIIC